MIALVTVIAEGPWPGVVTDTIDEDGFRDAVEIMQAMRRRIDADAASDDDLRRYRIACSTIERVARERDLPCLAVDARALTRLVGAVETIHPPQGPGALTDVADHWIGAIGTDHPLSRLIAQAAEDRAGLVISVQPIADRPVVELPGSDATATADEAQAPRSLPQREVAEAVAAIHEHTMTAVLNDPSSAGRARMRQAVALRAQIVDALRNGGVVPVGMAAPHDVITEVLRELQNEAIPSSFVRLVHMDGSEGAPFPIGARLQPMHTPTRTLRLGLMSIRHMKADPTVNGYWFRNRLVSVSDRTLAETEAFCYRDTLARLPELSAGGIDHIEMLHTGFEPAVIGFYRAVLNYAGTHQFAVTPRYLHRGGEVAGTPWPAIHPQQASVAHDGTQP